MLFEYLESDNYFLYQLVQKGEFNVFAYAHFLELNRLEFSPISFDLSSLSASATFLSKALLIFDPRRFASLVVKELCVACLVFLQNSA